MAITFFLEWIEMMKKTSNTSNIESTKRRFLRSAASVGLGSVAFAQGSLARKNTHDFVGTVKSSQQYQKISEVLTKAGFQPQFDQVSVFQVARKETPTGVGGTGMIVPTQNPGRPNASVELKAFQPANTNEIKLKAVVNKHGVYAGHVYTDSQIVETKPGYTTSHDPSSQGPMPFGDWLPIDPIPDDPIDTIIDAGESIVDGATGMWEETAEFVKNNDKVEDAVDLGEDIYGIGEVLSPVDGNEPPAGLNQTMENNGFTHCVTIDTGKACAYIAAAAVIGATGLTIATGGAGAISFAIPAAIEGACALVAILDAAISDIDGVCNPTDVYFFCPTGGPSDAGVPTAIPVPNCTT
ncbi:hypothetical protein [Natrinema salaciae]|uniref:Uncharacterized protein n=1 Tax=Natrinema salaciae TaxID=1186196 RepID=A0A1H9S474_9EURY|nr:hypothetical protein [Natrinema salaciae]SER79435.1 hypothetical protein SAMN04489841_4563 [Natrinema salaciae]